MTQDPPFSLFDWFANQFTNVRREEFIEKIYPHMKTYLKSGDRVVDLGCGAGSITIFLEEQGAQITGIDLAPGLIALAREEAIKRGAKVDFIQANILTHPLGEEIYDLAVCFGNPLTDIPHQSFPKFRDSVFNALKPGGHFLLEYVDGLERVEFMSDPEEVVEQGVDSQIARRFIEYNPTDGTYKMEFKHLSTNETYLGTEYVYIGPLIRLLMEPKFKFLESVQLEHSFMDVYVKH